MKSKESREIILSILFLLLCPDVFCQTSKDFNSVYESLRHYWYCKVIGCEKGKPYSNTIPYNPKFYTDSSRIQLLKILNNEREQGESYRLAKLSIDKYIDSEIENLIQLKDNLQLSQKQKKLTQDRLDSLIKIRELKSDTIFAYQQSIKKREDEILHMRIDNLLILVAGLTNDRRYVPILLKAVLDTVHFDQITVKLVLARFNEEPFHNEMIAHNRFDQKYVSGVKGDHFKLSEYFSQLSRNLLYISSQESFLELSKFLPTELRVTDRRALNMEDAGYSPVSRQAFESIVEKLNNKEIKEYLNRYSKAFNIFGKYNVPQETPIEKKHILFLKNWMQQNVNNYDIVGSVN